MHVRRTDGQSVNKPDPPLKPGNAHRLPAPFPLFSNTDRRSRTVLPKGPYPASADHAKILSQADRHHFDETDVQFPVFCQRCQPDDIFRRRLLHRDAVDPDAQSCTGQRASRPASASSRRPPRVISPYRTGLRLSILMLTILIPLETNSFILSFNNIPFVVSVTCSIPGSAGSSPAGQAVRGAPAVPLRSA